MELEAQTSTSQAALIESEAARIIQSAFKKLHRKKQLKREISKIGEIDSEKNILDNINEDEIEKEVANSTTSLKKIPYNVWIIVFSFAEGWPEFLKYQRVCKLWRKISNFSTVWCTFMQKNEPEIVEFILKKNEEENPRAVNWKVLIKASKPEVDENIQKIASGLLEIKLEGNQHFRGKDFPKALEAYKRGIEKSKEYEIVEKSPICVRLGNKKVILEAVKNITILHSNAAQAALNCNKWITALEMAKNAKKGIRRLFELCVELDIEFDKDFGLLMEKIEFRFKKARQRVFGYLRFVRYSENPVDGVRVGTMIEASDSISGDIFCKSQVLLTQYERGGVSIPQYFAFSQKSIFSKFQNFSEFFGIYVNFLLGSEGNHCQQEGLPQ